MRNNRDYEKARQSALDRLQVIDSPEELAYDDITRTAASIFRTPIALISLTDNDRQWFKSRVGLQIKETPREHGFCATAIQLPHEAMLVEDTLKDERFFNHPLVTGPPRVRFYVGAPLVTNDGHAIGTICVIDTVPRQVELIQLESLLFLSRQVMVMLESRAVADQAIYPKT